MRECGFPLPMRNLKASALAPSFCEAVWSLRVLDPALIGRIIPDRAREQQRWLRRIDQWRARTRHHREVVPDQLAWAAERLAKSGPLTYTQITTVADFMARGDRFNPSWGWARAEEEAVLWHDRITVERALRGTMFKPDSVVDAGLHPDRTTVEGHDFLALRTPLEITEEGAAMRHCVGSYIPSVINGRCHIVSIRKGEARLATAEFNGDFTLVQLKGKLNSEPAPDVKRAAEQYAKTLLSIGVRNGGGRW